MTSLKVRLRHFSDRLWHDRRGVAAVELALLSPILVMLFLGTFEVTQLIRVKTKMALAAQVIQNMVTGQNSATANSLAIAYSGGQRVMAPFAGSGLTAAVASVTFTSTGTASAVAWQTLLGGAPGMTKSAACTLAAKMSLGSDSVIVVKTTYAYTPVLSYMLGKSYALTQITYGRPRNTGSISGPSPSTGLTGNC
ncbi:MAG: TadE/TadG family type IV pilus assembly protein [Janthinobacterium lividum]